MRDYITLGTATTKVLATTPYADARVVTTTNHEAARAIARALQRADRCLAAALQPLARHLNGTPLEARRHLLAAFDQALASPESAAGIPVGEEPDLWADAHALVARLAAATEGCGPAVTAAVRRELGDHLDGLDGVLVPVWVIGDDGKLDGCPSLLNMALPCGQDPDRWWSYMLEHDSPARGEDCPHFPLGGPLIASTELDALVHDLYGQEPAGAAWSYGSDVADLIAVGDRGGYVSISVRADHLTAWVAHHRPADLAAFEAWLARAS